jgi:hypothetical protein
MDIKQIDLEKVALAIEADVGEPDSAGAGYFKVAVGKAVTQFHTGRASASTLKSNTSNRQPAKKFPTPLAVLTSGGVCRWFLTPK